MERNAFFAHHKNVYLDMVGDNNKEIRRLAIDKIQALRGKSLQHTIPNGNFKGDTSRNTKTKKVLLSLAVSEYLKFQ